MALTRVRDATGWLRTDDSHSAVTCSGRIGRATGELMVPGGGDSGCHFYFDFLACWITPKRRTEENVDFGR